MHKHKIPFQKLIIKQHNLACVMQNPLECTTVWELNRPFAIMDHEDIQQDRWCEVASRETGHCFWAAHSPLISPHSDANSCPQDVCLPTGRVDKCPASSSVCTFGHRSIKGLIAQLPYSTLPPDMLLKLDDFIPPPPLVHTHTLSGQQVKVKSTQHQVEAGD